MDLINVVVLVLTAAAFVLMPITPAWPACSRPRARCLPVTSERAGKVSLVGQLGGDLFPVGDVEGSVFLMTAPCGSSAGGRRPAAGSSTIDHSE